MRRLSADPVALVAGLLALDALAMLVTYSRVDPGDLYHVSGSGLGGGLSRVLVALDWPDALLAAAALEAVWHRLPRGERPLGWLAIALCAVVAVPGVVRQSDLDARAINVVPALGTVLAFAMALRHRERAQLLPVTLVVAPVLLLLSIPWLGAELGFHTGLGVFRTSQVWQGHPSVHLGYHHGWAGVLIVTSALLLLPLARARMARGWLWLLLVYGAVNLAQDFWFEQVVKRGWTTRSIPSAIVPRAHWIWLVMLVLGATAIALDRRRAVPPAAAP